MDWKRYLNSLNGLRTEAKANRAITLGLVVIILMETYFIINRPQVVTIVPFTATQDAQLTRDDASRSYFEAWGFALAEMVGNVTPGNVRFIGDRLKPLLDPRIYHEAMESINEVADQLTEERITQRFQPRRVTYEKATGKVFVFGTSYLRAGGSFEAERDEPRTYEFKMKIGNYAPIITDIDTYTGYERTKAALEKERKAQEKARKKSREQRAREAKSDKASQEAFDSKKEDRKLKE